MDVTFTNVLEGARQYFQGLPAGSNTAASPAYSTESHLRHEYDRGLPPSSEAYWTTDTAQASRNHTPIQRELAPLQREHSVLREHASSISKDHAVVIHRPASHVSEASSRPPPHLSQYVQTVTVPAEQNRAYYPGSYQEHYRLSQLHNEQAQQPPQQKHPPEHYQQPRQQQFEFSRPTARDNAPNYPQYQSPAGSPYQQSPSPYHQVPSPQQPRAPSREQTVPRVPSQERPGGASSREQYPSESYAYSPQTFYQQQPQPKVASGSISYKPSNKLQQYPPSSQPQHQHQQQQHQQQQQQQQQNVYYKHVYAPQQSHQSVFAASRQGNQSAAGQVLRNNSVDQTIRTTHNLPPIAALSNYHSSRVRDTTARTSLTTTSTTSSYTSGYDAPATSCVIQPNPAASSASNYRTNTSHQYQTQVIMTTSNSSTNYSIASRSQSSERSFSSRSSRTEELSPSNLVDNANGRTVVKKESPLDLSVKTVRTPADSTFDQDARNKYQRQTSLSTHNYPQLDVNSFRRNLTQRSAQHSTAAAPKVEFRPNFDVPVSLDQPSRRDANNSLQENANLAYRYPTASAPTAAHVNSYIRATAASSTPRFAGKRCADITVRPTLPSKVAKLTTDAWRQSIDLQIEERLSNYKQQQQQQAKLAAPSTVPLVNGTSFQEKPNYENTPQHSAYKQYHKQTYVPSPGTTHHHQYPVYNPSSQTSVTHVQPTPRSNCNSTLNTQSKNAPVDKRVLSLLRNSLEVKGQKKLELLKSNEHFSLRSDVQHPSTDVTAPLQPKPAFVNRNNVSPFTPTSFPDNMTTSTYKFHIPKAVDSVNFDDAAHKSEERSTQDTVITNHNLSLSPECDGLAAFLAARIRTKGELKQGGPPPPAQNSTGSKSQLHEVIENQLKLSPIKKELATHSQVPPKTQKDRLGVVTAPRKRLFSRNEEDATNLAPPAREPGLRSSSETSVFDFPDSDSENDTNRESLEAMRKCRKSTKQTPPDDDVKSPPRVPTPGDDPFSLLCDNFLEQLKSGMGKKKYKKKKGIEPEALSQLETVTKENPLEAEAPIKVEVVPTKEEPPSPPLLPPVLSPEVDLTAKIKEEPVVVAVVVVEADVKEEDPFLTNRKRVRRRILSSSDSSDENETDVNDNNNKSHQIKSDINEKEEKTVTNDGEENASSPQKSDEVLPVVVRPSKKPSFGDGSDFYPGWEEGVYKYKKSLRMPPTLIQVTRPPAFHRLSTSLPDLDPCPHSPTTSVSCDDKDVKSKGKRIKSEPLDSDTESNSGFNVFAKKMYYDSEGSSSIRSLPAGRETSILDRLLEKCGGRKRKKYKRKDDHSPKTVPKTDNAVELLPTPSLEIKEEADKNTKKLSNSPVIKAESPLLGFRKSTVSNFKDAFIKTSNTILNNQFTTVVLNSRTRRESRVQKQRATIKEVFGEDRPASAPPVTCVNDMRIKEEPFEEDNCMGNLVVRLEKDEIVERVADLKKIDIKKEMEAAAAAAAAAADDDDDEIDKEKDDDLLKTVVKKEVEEDSIVEDDTRSLDGVTVKSETPSIDGDDGSVSGKKRGKFGKIRRKLSSGFDYIRKKKKVKKDNVESDATEKRKRKITVSKTLESVDDIQKEIKTWVLNKGIGETHLHRAARLGYTDVTAYCLEKMECNPSPRDNAGNTPLHWACSKGHLQIAKLLLLYGANPSESAQGGIRPLHEAVENGFVEIARLLLSYGADPTLATYSGLTPLALTNDEVTKDFLMNHLNDIEGEAGYHWSLQGPSTTFDGADLMGYNVLEDVPDPDPASEEEDVEFEMSESLLPNLYTLNNEPAADRWVLLQDLSTILKIKSRDALLKQICPPSTSSGAAANFKSVIRELRMQEFLEQARCCQFLNAGEKINTRATKIALVKYTDKVRELLNIESVFIKAR